MISVDDWTVNNLYDNRFLVGQKWLTENGRAVEIVYIYSKDDSLTYYQHLFYQSTPIKIQALDDPLAVWYLSSNGTWYNPYGDSHDLSLKQFLSGKVR